MKKISVLSQLWVLSGFLLSIILILGIFSSWQATNLFQLLDHTAKSQVPAMRNMVMADMLHDGLRAVVMESYLASLKNDPNHLEQLVTESKEKSQEFHQYLNALKGLELSTPTVSAIEMSKPALVEYTNISQAIPLLLLSGKKNEAEIQKEKFNQSFAKLEEELEKLGELIEKEANQKSTSGSQILSIIIGITSLGIILGSLFAYGVLRSLKNRINGFLVTVLDNSTHMSTANENLQLTNKDLSASVSDSSSSLQETVASLD
ncbi:MAG: MCP four helix bundle domain-containing protein, partial [Bdellovibrionales bacterium]